MTWTRQKNPLDGVENPLVSIACSSERTCIVVGGLTGSTVLTTDDGGHTWTQRLGPSSFALSGLSCPTRGVCFADGGPGIVVMTRDGGRTWSEQTSGTDLDLSRIACSTPSFCVIVGTNGYISVLNQTTHSVPVSHGPPTVSLSSLDIYYMMDGPEYRSDIPLQAPAYIDAVYATSNSGVATPTGKVTISHNGRVIMTVSMSLQHPTQSYLYPYLRALFHIDDPALIGAALTATVTLTLGSSSSSRSIPFTIVENPLLPRPSPLAQATTSADTTTPTPVATVSASQPVSTPASTMATPTAGGVCGQWSIAGSWSFTAASTSLIGQGSATVVFAQNGQAVSGSLALGGVTWTISGTISGSNLTATLSASGQIDVPFTGVVSSSGTTITGDQGIFTGAASCAS